MPALRYYSVFDILKIGVGPSSSHTNAPLMAANVFVQNLRAHLAESQNVHRLAVDLYGSLALTGIGHGTLRAVSQGFLGASPETVPIVQDYLHAQYASVEVPLDEKRIRFVPSRDVRLVRRFIFGKHPNFMRFYGIDSKGTVLASQEFSSLGGGELDSGVFGAHGEKNDRKADRAGAGEDRHPVPFPFRTASELEGHCLRNGLQIAEIMMANEEALWGQSKEAVLQRLDEIKDCMYSSIIHGCESSQKVLPGQLHLARRAPDMYARIAGLDELERLSTYAIAVNEENAAGGRVVTAPTNGSAGVIPAIVYHYCGSDTKLALDFLLTAAAIGALYKHGASVSAAQVGCQGEIGVSSSMAAAGLAHMKQTASDSSLKRTLQAAGIAMQHHLGMTCDPAFGLVQVPCIERNAIGAIKAVAASKLALLNTSDTILDLDSIIKVMYETGLSMDSKLKETSLGGIAAAIADKHKDMPSASTAC